MTTITDAPVLVVGGAGFIGSNVAAHLARNGHRVRIYDDLSRPGVETNLAWLQAQHGDRISTRIADIRDRAELRAALQDVQAVFHFAAQVAAATTNLVDPRSAFDINAGGTLELLEAVRAMPRRPAVVFTSTNKVYGGLQDIPLRLDGTRWTPVDRSIAANGINERRPLEFRTPYGCSKGAAEQYVLDYAHSYEIPAAVFRLSCIYGPRQFGADDQGWVAHFLLRALHDAPITVYGDGHQVRDVLFVDDLVDALMRAWSKMETIHGHAFNIGGGPPNALSVVELLEIIRTLMNRPPEVRYEPWRRGDQRYYVSDTTAFTAATGWRPRIRPGVGVVALHAWFSDYCDRSTSSSPLTGVIRA